MNCTLTIEAWLKLIKHFDSRYLELLNACILILVYMLLNVRNGINFKYPSIVIYQSPLILTESFQHNLINVSYLTACYLYQVMMTLHFFNNVANDAESTQKQKNTS